MTRSIPVNLIRLALAIAEPLRTGRDRYWAQRARFVDRSLARRWVVGGSAAEGTQYIALRSLYCRRSKRRGKFRF